MYIVGQKYRIIDAIKRDLYRRSAVEPVIGYLKEDHRISRSVVARVTGDAINAILAAAGYNFRRILVWLKLLFTWFFLLATINRSENYQLMRA